MDDANQILDKVKEIELLSRVLCEKAPDSLKPKEKKDLYSLDARLKRAGKTLDQFLESDYPEELADQIVQKSIKLYILPAFPEIARSLVQKAKDGSPSQISLVFELVAKMSAFMRKYAKGDSEQKHLHLHFEKMEPDQLAEESLYQAKQILYLQIQLPGGVEKIRSLFRSVMKSARLKKSVALIDRHKVVKAQEIP